MRIVAFVNANSGPSYHRVIAPLLLMPNADVFVTNNLLEEHFEKGCDIFMYNRTLPEHCDSKIKELKKKHGFKTCVDIDDYWELDPWHILYAEYQKENFAALQVRHIRDADFVLTTNSRLAAKISVINSRVYVVPNAIPKAGQFVLEREPSPFFRLFWQGSITHERDIQILERPVDQLKTIAPRIKMVMAGYHENSEEWHRMALTYTAGAKHQYKLIPGARVDKYYEAYAHADACLIPLRKSKFNSFKSNLKVLEAANLGLPVIASQVEPYLGMPLLYCKTGSDWVKHIKSLEKSRKRRKEAGAKLKEFCDTHYNFDKINEQRKTIFKTYCKQKV